MKENESSANPLKALDILEALSTMPEGGTLNDITLASGLSKSTAFRIVNALADRHYVERNEKTKTYKLGFKLLGLSSAILDSVELKRMAREEMNKLAELTGETVHLICRDGNEGFYLAKVDTSNAIGLKSQVGKHIPLYCTAGGKALLAYMDESFFNEYVASTTFRKFTPYTLTTYGELAKEMEKIRSCGYSVDNQEHNNNMTCIGAPVFDSTGACIGSLGVSAPTYRFPLEKALEYVPQLLELTKEVSAKCGYQI